MGVTELIIGAYQVDKGKKLMAELEKKGVDPLSPEYKKMQGMAEELSKQGFSYQQIQAYINGQLKNVAAANYNAKQAVGGNFGQAMLNNSQYQVGLGNADFAAKDAEMKNQNVDRLFNTYQVLQDQKTRNLQRYDQQMAAAQGIASAGAANVATGITDIKNTVLGSFTGGGGNTGKSGFKDPNEGNKGAAGGGGGNPPSSTTSYMNFDSGYGNGGYGWTT